MVDESGSKDLGSFSKLNRIDFYLLCNCKCYIVDVKEYVIKAQILAGGRGKGHFDNGFKGGVQITQEYTCITIISICLIIKCNF